MIGACGPECDPIQRGAERARGGRRRRPPPECARYWVFTPSRLADGADESCGFEVSALDAPPDVPAPLDGALDTVPVPAVEPLLARLLEPELPVDEVSAPAGAGAVFTELEADGIELPEELALPLPARTELPVPDVSDAFGAAPGEPAAPPLTPVGEPDIVAVGEPLVDDEPPDDEPLDDVVPEEDGVPDEDDLLPPEPLSPQAPSARRPTMAVAVRRRLPISLLPSCKFLDDTAETDDVCPCIPKNGRSYGFIPMRS